MIVNDTFLDRVAHDLRGELATMLAGLHYLQRFGTEGSSSSRNILARVTEAGDRLTRLLDEFDDAAWLLEQPKPLTLESLSLRTLGRELLERSAKLTVLRGVELRLDLLDDDEREFMGDREMLVRALLYVADFAMLRATSGEIRATAGFINDVPVVRIIDEGPAVPEFLQPTLCDPFVENELASLLPAGRRRVRMGLGLAISRAIIEAHRGSLILESLEPPQHPGLAFHCRLARP
ncbi:MAG TPA: HAMP domain-containing sensor histidine kinase [Polyangium sp.]|nr:HAMP domain-containing sensor histidine kinase [Polyangium sp.]